MDIETKYTTLVSHLRQLDKLLVAFSGGVDSALLLAAAREARGEDLLAVSLISPMFTDSEKSDAVRIATALKVKHQLVEVDPLTKTEFTANTPDRCYICKKFLFSELLALARREGGLTIVEGSNYDDLSDYRPGKRALRELGILSPLVEVQLTKPEIRKLCARLGLDCWDKPSLACLATRIPYHKQITGTRLRRIEKAEQLIRNIGVTQVRVRDYGISARVEIMPDQFDLILAPAVRTRLLAELNELGFKKVMLDLAGYRSGSMNDDLSAEDTKR